MPARTITAAGVAAAALTLAPAVAGAGAAAQRRTAEYSVRLAVPSRLQWDENDGYCGEMSFISAGLSYGQYLSQYDARAIASPGVPQYEDRSQLLLGVNAASAARRMRLRSQTFRWSPGTTSEQFLTWVKRELIEGHPVAIGVYMNESRFGVSNARDAGDPDYDHIVLVTGITSRSPLTLPAVSHPSDTLTFSDNGLWAGRPGATFTYAFGSFGATRAQADARHGPIYSLADRRPDFGIALAGVDDANHETVPVSVATGTLDETPDIRDGSGARPRARRLRLTVTVSGLRAGVVYRLYRYDSVRRVPRGAFNAHRDAAARAWTFTATGPTRTLTQSIVSRDEVIYRAVPASAP